MRWGLTLPREQFDAPPKPLNSLRIEAIREQISWRRLFNHKRCIVPVSQFFEWKRVAGIKTKEYKFRLKSGRPMMIAGLWDRTGQSGDAFAYITGPANGLFSFVHDRMPIILDEEGLKMWFDPNAAIDKLLALLEPIASDEIELSPVLARPSLAAAQLSLFHQKAA